MRLKSILNKLFESEASDQAHALGLFYKGHGYWADKSGVTKAQTVGNKLVKLDPSQVPAEHQGKAKTEPEPAPTAPENSFQHPNVHPKVSLKDKQPGVFITGTVANYVMNQPVDVGIKKGMNEGGTYKGADGVVRYVKFYNNPVAAYDEKVANDIYLALGLAAPKSLLFHNNEGKVGFASNLIANDGELGDFTNPHTGLPKKDICDEILQGFVADCFLANWDVIGVNEGYMRNIVLTGAGHPTAVARIDNGGALLTGGLGNAKPEAALNALAEWSFFPQKNPSYSQIFKGAGYTSPEQIPTIKQQIKDVLDLRNNAGGWSKFMEGYTHDIKDQNVTQKITSMLEARSVILANKYKEMGGLHEDTTPKPKSKDKSCIDCTRVKRTHSCERCGAKRCPHYMKQSKTGYVCPSNCGTQKEK